MIHITQLTGVDIASWEISRNVGDLEGISSEVLLFHSVEGWLEDFYSESVSSLLDPDFYGRSRCLRGIGMKEVRRRLLQG